jgi:hypothetical protein
MACSSDQSLQRVHLDNKTMYTMSLQTVETQMTRNLIYFQLQARIRTAISFEMHTHTHARSHAFIVYMLFVIVATSG